MKDVGPISGVVNAAAITARGNLLTETAQGFDLQMAVNVRAPFLITQAAAQHMMEHKKVDGTLNSIVNICSVAAHGGAPFIMSYSASKSALVALTKNNAAQLAPHQIRVNAINMGWCLTDNEHALQKQQSSDGEEWSKQADQSVPLGRILRPRDVAATVAFLLSGASAMMTGSILELHPEFAEGMLSLSVDESER
jgi:NAD(P)-dependent dehydrogenase (short-subunit alcohol dehydrogenase family)